MPLFQVAACDHLCRRIFSSGFVGASLFQSLAKSAPSYFDESHDTNQQCRSNQKKTDEAAIVHFVLSRSISAATSRNRRFGPTRR